MKLIFGFDIDGVLTNDDDGYKNLWLIEAEKYFQEKVIRSSFYIEEALNKTRTEVEEFFEARANYIFENVPAREHAAETLQTLWDEGHTIHLITARSEDRFHVTKNWLKKHSFPYHSLTMSPEKEHYCKGERCAELKVDFFIDDKYENAKDVAKQGIYTLLFHASHNREKETTLPRVTDWLEIQTEIEAYKLNSSRQSS